MRELARPVVIDEVQRVPELVLAIKLAVDLDPVPGSFVLTGSSDTFTAPGIVGELAGRMERITLWPLTQAEIERTPGAFVDRVFEEGARELEGDGSSRADIIGRAIRGGFPEAVSRSGARRDRWFDSYVADVVEREMRDAVRSEGWLELPNLLRLVAARGPGPRNLSDLARDAGLARPPAARYLGLLGGAYLIHMVPAWASSAVTRLVKSPRAVLADSGLMAALNGVSARRIEREPGLSGPLVETFVLCELRRLVDASELRPSLHHFRTHEGAEVDAVLEARDGRIVAIEVKASASPDRRDLRGLRYLAERHPDRFVAGLLLYTGTETVPFGSNLWAVPISALWCC